jgi:hypothetical protein
VIVTGAFVATSQRSAPSGVGFVMEMAWVWALSLVAAAIFVIPVLALAPRLRRPPFWIAAIWGAGVAWASSTVFFGRLHLASTSIQGLAGLAAAGSVSGILYAFLVRRAKTQMVES